MVIYLNAWKKWHDEGIWVILDMHKCRSKMPSVNNEAKSTK